MCGQPRRWWARTEGDDEVELTGGVVCPGGGGSGMV